MLNNSMLVTTVQTNRQPLIQIQTNRLLLIPIQANALLVILIPSNSTVSDTDTEKQVMDTAPIQVNKVN